MRTTRLDNLPRYLAISYTWGEPVFDNILQCDDHDMRVTANLYAALQRVREKHEFADIHFMWADAVCIDQSNIKERSQQVQLMRRIYQSAHLTFVYLGESEEPAYCKLAMAAVKKAQGLGDHEGFDLTLDSIQFNAVHEMLSQPWFRRVWIVQEYAVSRNLMIGYGNELCSSAELVKFADALGHHDLERPGDQSTTLVLLTMFQICQNIGGLDGLQQMVLKGQAEHLSDLLYDAGGSFREATDPRDLVYALIGLVKVPEKAEVDLIPDYSLSVVKVYLQAAGFILEHEGLIELLERCDRPSTIDGLPSWVPDWSSTPAINSRKMTWGDHSAGGHMETEWQTRGEAQMLSVQGNIFDTVLETNDAREHGTTDTTDHMTLSSLCLGAYNMTRRSEHTIANVDVKTLFYRTLLLDEWESMYDLEKYVSQLPEYPDSKLFESPGTEDPIEGFVGVIRENVKSFEYCLTRNKRVGMLPLNTQKGDYICVFQGVDSPYVLRKQGLVDTYALIGACYIDGVMRGDAFDEAGRQYIDLV